MKERNAHDYMKGAILLTISAVVVKVLSAVYRIPYQNLTGDFGMYVYQQLYPFYALFVVLSGTAFPMLLSKYMAKENKKSEEHRAIFYWMTIVGVLMFLLLQMFKGPLAKLLGHPAFEPSLAIISFFYLLLPFLVYMRSYYQVENRIAIIAKANVLEQFIRVGSILFVAILGVRMNTSVYQVGYYATVGALIAAFISLLYFSKWFMRNVPSEETFRYYVPSTTFFRMGKIFFKDGIAFSITSLIIILFQFVDSLLFLPMLQKWGTLDINLQELKGIYDRAQPLIQLGSVVGASFALAIVPLIVRLKIMKKTDEMVQQLKDALWLALVFSFTASFGMLAIIRPLNIFLYENANGTSLLAWNVLSIGFTGYILTCTAILHSIGSSRVGGRIVLIGIVLKLACLVIFVPNVHVYAFPIANLISYGWVSFMLARIIKQKYNISFFQGKLSALCLVVGSVYTTVFLVISLLAKVEAWNVSERMEAVIISLAGALLGVIIFVLSAWFSNLFTKRHVAILPLGSKWSKWLKE